MVEQREREYARLMAEHEAMDKPTHVAMVLNHLGQFSDSEIDGIVERFNPLPSVPPSTT
jgi:hypothetical protein